MSSLNERLRKARERKGLSQTEVSRRTNINNKTLSRYEKGGSEPDIETVKILAELYEVSSSYLLTGEEEDITNDADVQFILRARDELDKKAFDELMSFTKRMKEVLERGDSNSKD